MKQKRWTNKQHRNMCVEGKIYRSNSKHPSSTRLGKEEAIGLRTFLLWFFKSVFPDLLSLSETTSLQKESQVASSLFFHLSTLDLLAPFKNHSPRELCFAGEISLALTGEEVTISNQKANIRSWSAPVSQKMHHVWISRHLVDVILLWRFFFLLRKAQTVRVGPACTRRDMDIFCLLFYLRHRSIIHTRSIHPFYNNWWLYKNHCNSSSNSTLRTHTSCICGKT